MGEEKDIRMRVGSVGGKKDAAAVAEQCNGGDEAYLGKAAQLCREYLQGSWKHVNADNIVMKRIR